MSSSTKVFIYSGHCTGHNSREDLSTFFKTSGVFKNADVCENVFESNFSGLKNSDNPTFVIPGGQALQMGTTLKPKWINIQRDLKVKYNYVGICAGAFAACEFAEAYKLDSGKTPLYSTSSQDWEANLGVVSNYEALGPFYPIPNAILNKKSRLGLTIPYRVTLEFSDKEKLDQLYIAGPLFTSTKSDDKKQNCEIIAKYSDCRGYLFAHEKNRDKLIAEPSAIIASEGIFLSGTHCLETCVENSKLLSFWSKPTATQLALSETDVVTLKKNRESHTKVMVPLLQRILNAKVS